MYENEDPTALSGNYSSSEEIRVVRGAGEEGKDEEYRYRNDSRFVSGAVLEYLGIP